MVDEVVTAKGAVGSLEDRLEALIGRLSAGDGADAALLEMLLADIRERRRIEAELTEAQRWSELAQEVAGACAYTFDVATGALAWSPSTRSLYGFAEDVVPTLETWLARVHPQDRARVQAVAAAAIERGASIDHLFRIVRPSGEVRHIRDRGRAMGGEGGQPLRVIGLNVDVTELVEARDTAQEAQRLKVLGQLFAGLQLDTGVVRLFLDALPTGVMVSDASRGAVFINRALEEMWRGGAEIRSAADWNKYEAWSAETGALLSDEDWPLAKAILTGRTQATQEVGFRRFDGSVGCMLVSATPVIDRSGELVSAFAIAQDITEWKAAEERAYLQTAFLRQLGDITPDYLFVKDRQSRLLYANSAVVRSTGRTWTELEGHNESDWHTNPEEADAILANDARIMSSGASETVEETYTSVSGRGVYRVTKTPIKDASGQVVGLAGIAADVTAEQAEQRHLELLVNELNHRVKNCLAIVQSIARHAFRGIDAAAPAYERFESRLMAMAAAHDLLSDGRWAGALVRDVVGRTVRPHASKAGQLEFNGPDLEITPQVALAISMAVHELCTNATKYGALSTDGGRVAIDWRLDEGQLVLNWTERDGPPVAVPTRTGFGMRMLKQAMAGIPSGGVDVVFEPCGIRCEIRGALV